MTSTKTVVPDLVECPRDAMQGWPRQIETAQKIAYLNALLHVGFHTLDCGSFVSPKAIPQMADTAQVLQGLQLQGSVTKLLVIVANSRGAEAAVGFEQVSYLGFPFSLSETFQQRNTNSSMEVSLERLDAIQNLCLKNSKQLVVYLSMGFGNPYGDPYNDEILLHWANEMVRRDIRIVSLADTVGLASAAQISFALNTLLPRHPHVTFGVHLHATPANWSEKLAAALDAGCTRIDGALKGIGGCPMAGSELVGNLRTEDVIGLLEKRKVLPALNRPALQESLQMAAALFA